MEEKQRKQPTGKDVKKWFSGLPDRLEAGIKRMIEGKPKSAAPELRHGEQLLDVFEFDFSIRDFMDVSVVPNHLDVCEIIDHDVANGGIIGACNAEIVVVSKDTITGAPEKKVSAVEIWINENSQSDMTQPGRIMLTPPNFPEPVSGRIIRDVFRRKLGTQNVRFETAEPNHAYTISSDAIRLVVEVIEVGTVAQDTQFSNLRLKLHVIKKPKASRS